MLYTVYYFDLIISIFTYYKHIHILCTYKIDLPYQHQQGIFVSKKKMMHCGNKGATIYFLPFHNKIGAKLQPLGQGFPTLINHRPHTCQPGHKVGRMEQTLGEFY